MLSINHELQEGRYRITKLIGQGKTTSFYEVYDKVPAKNVLLKETSVQINVFDDESKFLSEINHDGFLQIFDHFSESNNQYLVMELVDGKNVGELIKNSNRLISPANVLDWGKQILDALDYLHRKTPLVVYFNLKPTNLYLTSDEQIKLPATGIASTIGTSGKIKKEAFDAANLNYSPLEIIWEKLDLASQRVILNGFDAESEQNLMKSPDARSDVYSLGATLYHLLTGKLPVNALERSIELLENNPDPLPAPDDIDAEIAVELSDALMKALQIKREDRFQTALEMREELENVFALLRERKIRELQNQVPDTLTLPVIKPKPIVVKTQNVSYETPKIEAEENRQFEILKQKLREAEAQKFIAEQRAAVAEKRLNEIESHETEEDDILELSELPEFSLSLPNKNGEIEEITQEDQIENTIVENDSFEKNSIETQKDLPEKIISAEVKQDSGEVFGNLFAEPQSNNKIMKRMVAVAVVILAIGGGVWGVLNFLPSANQEITNQTVSANEPIAAEPQPSVQPTPEIELEQTPELSETQTADESVEPQQSFTKTNEKPVAVKEKTPVPQIASAKPPAPKPSAEDKKKKVTVDELINDTPPKKKKVTVDDLINDN